MAKKSSNFDSFYNEYGKALDDKQAALFIGAGLSMASPANLKGWPEVLSDVAVELGLDVKKETDLPALAQFHFNEKKVRNRLTRLIVDEYGREDVPLTTNHRLIAKLPIGTVWTTNYDHLIERSFRETGKRCDVRITQGNFSSPPRGRDVTIYKMHGDASLANEATFLKDDYEIYNLSKEKEVFSTALRGDLVTKTVLFLGFSFTDSNLDYILSRVRWLMGQDAQQHYCILRWPKQPSGRAKARAQHDYDMVRLELRISDLKRYGIEALMINEYDEITQILEELNKRAHRKTLFVSGSAHTYAPMDQQRVEQLAYLIGKEIIQHGFNLVSGFGLGIGGAVMIGAAEEVYRDEKAVLAERVIMRPFPQLPPNDPKRKELYDRYRHDILSTTGFTIFLCGNKLDPATSTTVSADGVREEFRISRELGKFCIPVGATGYIAKEIWDEVSASPSQFFPGINVKKPLQALGDPNKTNEELVEAIFSIIKLANK